MTRLQKNFYSGIIIFLLACIFVSCAPLSNNGPLKDISKSPYKDFLDIVVLIDQGGINKNDFELSISNKTLDCVVVSQDFGVQVFTLVSNEWLEIPSFANFANDTEIMLTPAYDSYSDTTVSIAPDYSSLNESPQSVRVVLNGKLCRNGVPTSRIVSDYIDIDFEN